MEVDRSLVIGPFKSAEQINQCRDLLKDVLGESVWRREESYTERQVRFNMHFDGEHWLVGSSAYAPNITPEEFLARYSEPEDEPSPELKAKARAWRRSRTYQGKEMIQALLDGKKLECGDEYFYMDEDGLLRWSDGDMLDNFNGVVCNPRKEYIEPPNKLKGFINVFPSGAVKRYETKEEADHRLYNHRIACIDLSDFYEGHGLGGDK